MDITIYGLRKRGRVRVKNKNETLRTLLNRFCQARRLDPSAYLLKRERERYPIDLDMSFMDAGLLNHATLELIRSEGAPVPNTRAARRAQQGPQTPATIASARRRYPQSRPSRSSATSTSSSSSHRQRPRPPVPSTTRSPPAAPASRATAGATKKPKQTVATVALQIASTGERCILPCQRSQSLLRILLEAEHSNPSMNLTRQIQTITTTPPEELPATEAPLLEPTPSTDVLTYTTPLLVVLNQQFGTLELLRRSTLSSIGVESGARVMIRVRDGEVVEGEENVNATLEEIESVREELAEERGWNVPDATSVEVQTSDSAPTTILASLSETETETEVDIDVDVETETETETDSTTTTTTTPPPPPPAPAPRRTINVSIPLPNVVATEIKLFQWGSGEESSMEDVTEDLFEMSAAEMISSIPSGETPLMTREYREQLRRANVRQYDQALIRVRFASGLMLQGRFDAMRHTLGDVKQMVDEVLQPLDNETGVGEIPQYYFYVAPPVRRFPVSDLRRSLADLQLAPAVMINVGCEEGTRLALKEEIVQEYVQDLGGVELIPEARQRGGGRTVGSGGGRGGGRKRKRGPGSGGAGRSAKKPRWLRL